MTVAQGDWLDVTPPDKAHLIYMDPPYMSQQDYSQFDDRWESRDHYLGWMEPRLLKARDCLRSDGSFMLHCDQTASHYLKILLDCIFGHKNFRNDIIWAYRGWLTSTKKFPAKHDNILFYAKSGQAKFFPPYGEMAEATLKGYNKDDGDGRLYVFGNKKVNGKTTQDRTVKIYLDESRGAQIPDWWSDINVLQSRAKERTGYPTQKPVALLARIIAATTDPGDLVVDPMCGSGTTLVAAKQMGREYWGCDISADAVRLAVSRVSGATVPLPLDKLKS